MSHQEQKTKSIRPRFVKIDKTILVTDDIISVQMFSRRVGTVITYDLSVNVYDGHISRMVKITFDNDNDCDNWFKALERVAEDNIVYTPADL